MDSSALHQWTLLHSEWKHFDYKPLDASRHEIRVLSLASTDPRELCFTLEHVSLDDWKPEFASFRAECPASWDSYQVTKEWDQKQSEAAPGVNSATCRFAWGDYTAISHRWGSLGWAKNITVNGMLVTVSKDLALCLVTMASKKRKIWVDAVCIDQDDVADRNANVQQMRDIYGQAWSVFVWLGQDEEEVFGRTSPMEQAFNDIFRCQLLLMGHDRQTLEAALGVDVEAWKQDHTYARLTRFLLDHEVLYFDQSDAGTEFRRPHFRRVIAKALAQLLQDPYWTRLWILQELTVCSAFVVSWGDEHIFSDLLFMLAEVFCDKILDSGTLPPKLVAEVSPGLRRIYTIGQWRKSEVFRKREDGLQGAALDDLCRLAKAAQCTLPQDRAYGLLGLLPARLSSRVPVDYNQDMATLKASFAAVVPAAASLWAADEPMYVLQDVPGKGKGLVATRAIAKGTRILAEKPLLLYGAMSPQMLQACIQTQVDDLRPDQRAAFLALHNIHPYKTAMEQYMGILKTNGLPVDCDLFDGAIFREASRINHACDNNAQKNWNDGLQQHTVQAMRDIAAGEEITISYLYPLRTRQERQRALQDKFGFACACHLCALPPAESRASDQRLVEIRRLDARIDSTDPLEGVLQNPRQSLRYFDQQIQLYQEQGREDVGFAQTLVNAAKLVLANGDLARGHVLMDWAASVWTTTIGADSAQAAKQTALARDPSQCETYGWTSQWRTRLNAVPEGLAPDKFQDWLWRRDEEEEESKQEVPWRSPPREKPRAVKPANLRDTTTFPPFAGLPDHGGPNADFYVGQSRRPRRHWCFLGEIVGFRTTPQLEMDLKDVGGETHCLHFCTARQGKEVEPIQLQKRYTVAVLYASRHVFSAGQPGIQHDDPLMIRIFPVSLNHLLALNDRIQEFSTETDGMRTCHRCGKKTDSMKMCKRCLLFWYCNKTCQTAGWKKKGHKADCGLLEDPDLRNLFVFPWDQFLVRAQFPLRAE